MKYAQFATAAIILGASFFNPRGAGHQRKHHYAIRPKTTGNRFAKELGDKRSHAFQQLVIKVLQTVFVNRDTSVVATHFASNYIQHNPLISNGPQSIPPMVSALPKEFRYEMGMVVAQGDLVMAHGRYTGWGPKPMIAVDIFCIVDGKLVEHWDVMQEEVPTAATASGNPMFGEKFGRRRAEDKNTYRKG
jgi:predicted SnoaL-like aldol condensation-catalyzing enzyme